MNIWQRVQHVQEPCGRSMLVMFQGKPSSVWPGQSEVRKRGARGEVRKVVRTQLCWALEATVRIIAVLLSEMGTRES